MRKLASLTCSGQCALPRTYIPFPKLPAWIFFGHVFLSMVRAEGSNISSPRRKNSSYLCKGPSQYISENYNGNLRDREDGLETWGTQKTCRVKCSWNQKKNPDLRDIVPCFLNKLQIESCPIDHL